MLTQPLLDKLTQLRLPAFRAALEEQLHNPQYADLPFEDRLGFLVDRECTHRDNNRLKRRLRAARLLSQATIEDLDLAPSRGLDRRLVRPKASTTACVCCMRASVRMYTQIVRRSDRQGSRQGRGPGTSAGCAGSSASTIAR